jgi:hypothetical protein
MLYNGLDLTGAPRPAYAFAVYADGVELGLYDAEGFSFAGRHEEKDLLELHIFDKEKEFRAVRSQSRGKFITPAIIEDAGFYKDGGGEEQPADCIDEYMQLFGERCVLVEEGRDALENLPFPNGQKPASEPVPMEQGETVLEDKGAKKTFYLKLPKERLSIGVRNYLDYDENQMVFLKQYRLTGIYAYTRDEKTKEGV